ncbi:hypothetical protein BD809_10560 [Aquimarina intermedia]|uniref:DUF5723 domain-containing protein n=2 Tax=Aquimarina intermedia TaxID=350814 RepID=A0A5S5C673_9FLAO|nr:hypothetical protein BD809_10560 [Aquimarina intermedia]
MRRLVTFFFILSFCAFSQNKPGLYDYSDLPQSLMSNPGTTIEFDYHAGVPLFSQFHINAGLKGGSLYDIIADDGRTVDEKITAKLEELSSDDYLTINQQLELLSFGWRSKKNPDTYFSGGMYEEFDFMGYFPKDLAVLAYEGNQEYLNQDFSFSDFAGTAELLTVFHFGYTKQIDDRLTFGARAKIYSSMFNVRSTKNKGTFTTIETPDGNNIYRHIISDANVVVKTSGYADLREINDSDSEEKAKEYKSTLLKKAFLGGNLGVGIDVGFSYKLEEQWIVTGSLTDFGLIVYNKDVETYAASGDYAFDGFESPIQFTGSGPQDFLDDLKESLSADTLSTSYTAMRPLKLNGSIKHVFNRYDDGTCNCYVEGKTPPYTDAFGFQFFSQFRPKRPVFAGSFFYYKRWFNFLRTKINYTIDEHSYYNVGLLVSTHFKPINMYIAADNLFAYSNVAKARGASLQLGINVVF